MSQRGCTSVDQRRGVMRCEHAHGPITLLGKHPQCARPAWNRLHDV